ncbi:MAG: hypothetical protein KA792_04630 [Bacteroidales bacterium]|nr:hypothetical protein [Bacteroidales bacterium]
MKKLIIISALILGFITVRSQERIGASTSLYGGISSMTLNPALIVGSPFRYDFNYITIQSYLDNNYVYLKKANLIKLIADNGKTNIYAHNDYNVKNGKTSKMMLYDRYYKFPSKNVYQHLLIQGPSLMLSMDKWSLAFTTNIRTATSLVKADYQIAKVNFEGMVYSGLMHKYINTPPFRINNTSWAELGIAAGTILKRKNFRYLKAAVTYKFLLGFDNFYYHNKSGLMYYPNDDDMYFYYMNAEYGHSVPVDKLQIIGTGHSFDIGFTYQKFERFKYKNRNRYNYKKGLDCPAFCKINPYMLYKWKVGFSLLDIGFISCNKNAVSYNIVNQSSEWYNFAHFAPKGIDGFDNSVSFHFKGDTIALPDGEAYTALTPLAGSFQFDYNISDDYYFNFTILQRLPHFDIPAVDRANLVAFTARYDTEYLGISLPVVFYQYMYPRLGLAVRFANIITVGTDKLGCLLNNRMSGMDIYFSIKMSAFNKCK